MRTKKPLLMTYWRIRVHLYSERTHVLLVACQSSDFPLNL